MTKETPMMQLGFKVERSVYYEFQKIIKRSKTTNSEFLREMLKRELKTPVIYAHDTIDTDQRDFSQISN